MIWGGSGYKVLLVLHLLSVVVGFGPWFLNGLLPQAALKRGDAEGQAISDANFRVSNISQFAIYGVFIFGMGTLSLAKKGASLKVSQPWAWIAIILWVAIIGVLHGMILPAQRSLKDGKGNRAALTQRQSLGAALINLMVIAAIILMVFEPGGPHLP